jgi:hypothetical protein
MFESFGFWVIAAYLFGAVVMTVGLMHWIRTNPWMRTTSASTRRSAC